MAIDIPQAMLPIYQRYLDQETADALNLFFQGPLGEQIAKSYLQRAVEAVHSGTSGADTAARALGETSHSDLDLGAKRLNELSPDDQKRVIAAVQVIRKVWKPISNEMAASYDDLVNNVVQKEIAAHNQELAAAQQAYLRKSSSHAPAQH
jgi:hypothetical protein